ncbi:MAG: MarR family transcriptional regulator [Pseudomonadota bacterium]
MSDDVRLSGPVSPDFDYAAYPFYLLSRAAGRYNAAMEAALRPFGLDQARWRILIVLVQHDQLGTQDIARKVVYKLSTTTRVIQRLEGAGLVKTLQSSKDGRITNVHITEAGRALVDKTRDAANTVFKAAFEGVPAKDIDVMCAQLKNIDERLRPDAEKNTQQL